MWNFYVLPCIPSGFGIKMELSFSLVFFFLLLDIALRCEDILTSWLCEKATGGGAYKYADLFREKLGISIEKEDEMNCLVAGANFLLKVQSEFKYLLYL